MQFHRSITTVRLNNACFSHYNNFDIGILIKARHLGYRKNVLGLCSFNAQEHSFVSPISNKYITVEEYFLEGMYTVFF